MRLSDRCILQVVHPGSLVDYVDCGGIRAIRNHLVTLLERSSVFRDDSLMKRPQITTGMVWETGPWAFLKFRLFVCWNWSSSDFSKGRITKKGFVNQSFSNSVEKHSVYCQFTILKDSNSAPHHCLICARATALAIVRSRFVSRAKI